MKRKLVCLSILMVLLSFACQRDREVHQSMVDIHKEKGVPVQVTRIAPREFSAYVSYHAALSGVEESIAGMPMDEKIEKVLVKTGDHVQKGQILVTLPADSPASQYQQAEINYRNSKTAFERIEGLYRAGGISLQERDNAKARYEVAQANWDAVRQTIKVEAPIDGMVTRVFVNETDNVKKESPLVTIAKTHRLKAVIWVSEVDIDWVAVGKTARVEWLDQSCQGTVTHVDLALNPQNHGFRAVVEFDNPDNRFKPGVTARVLLQVHHNPQAVVVKRKDIFGQGREEYVYLVENGKAKKQPIRSGFAEGMDVEVLEGLSEGNQLIVSGNQLLEDGVKVQVQP